VFVPLWREHEVIRRMVEHNLSAIEYVEFDFFIGVYPNDGPTVDAVRELESQYYNVHMTVCPHGGPTSKADCLNWIYQSMLLFEETSGERFDVVVIHDAEDVIGPLSLHAINYHADTADMIQTPVLPAPSAFHEFTHGVYCDEFAEMALKDMPVREFLGGFLPSCGVGTGFTREALGRLAETASNRIFEPVCLTEDYENGYRVHRLGFRQVFLTPSAGHAAATREYFPRTVKASIRQKTRWVTGIVLQTWERHGWSGGAVYAYWWWRDRKAIVGSFVGAACNLLFFYGAAVSLGAHLSGAVNPLRDAPSAASTLLPFGLALQICSLSVRMVCTARIYGFWFACGAPLRASAGNFINSAAAACAIWQFARS
jgi:adsorption protein B